MPTTELDPLFWIRAEGRTFPLPVVGVNDHNVYAELPGTSNLAVLPISQRGRTWSVVQEVCR